MGAQRASRWTRRLPAGYSLLLTLLITAPLLRPGYLLLRDAVSTPRSYLTDTALGLGDAAPRAVPQDALLATLSVLVDGGALVTAILVAALWAAGYGAALLARDLLRAPPAAQLVATTLAVWNPYVAERLLQGHWSLLTGYAALPWIAMAALRIRVARPSSTRPTTDSHPSSAERTAGHDRSDGFRSWAVLAGLLAAAGLTPTGALLGAIVALTIAGARRSAGVLGLVVAACVPWLLATAVSGVAAEPSDPAGVPAFAARAEPWLGTVGSLAGLGGIWNADAVPGSRTTPLAVVATILLLAVVVFGIRGTAAADGDPERTRARRILLILAAAAVALPALAATPAGLEAMEWLVVHIPGAGLFRDTQKFVALAVPAFSLCAAAACSIPTVRRPTRSPDAPAAPGEDSPAASGPTTAAPPARDAPAPGASHADRPGPMRASMALVALFIGMLILPLPDLAWGVGGQIQAVQYPDSWSMAAERIDGPGDIAVLPGGMFRRFPYSGSAPVLDPAPRMLPRDVLQTGALPVRGETVAGEGVRARTVENLLLAGGDATELARLGVGWVLVEQNTPGPMGDSAATLAQLKPVFDSDELRLYRVPEVTPRPAPQHRALVIGAHSLWALLLVTPLLAILLRRLRRPSR
ncbi:hypothetical protein [Nocardia carnea]|uniref:hypothetical protein n=1 Tax=Nocardia carnea TaxID=37328 RepID=UPI002455E242|nr:hypothetical protein [Nocardia carnea]